MRETGRSGILFDFQGDYEDRFWAHLAASGWRRWSRSGPPQPSEAYDTGWVVLVQEHLADTHRPLDDLSAKLVTGSILALAVAVVVVTALWGLVLFVLEAPSGSWLARFLRRRAGLPSSSGGSSPGAVAGRFRLVRPRVGLGRRQPRSTSSHRAVDRERRGARSPPISG
jgi:hypothetical protein